MPDDKWEDLDYLRTADGTFYLAKGSHHCAGVRAYPVYWPDRSGDRYRSDNSFYRKEIIESVASSFFLKYPSYEPLLEPLSVPKVPLRDIRERLRPREATARFLSDKEQDSTRWRLLHETLISSAEISEDDIGIIGSYLIGLHSNRARQHVKDIDFVVYGVENSRRVHQNISEIRKRMSATEISMEHVAYHVRKFAATMPLQVSLELTLQRKWPSLQLSPGLLSTIRFVYGAGEAPPDPWQLQKVKELELSGEVTDATHSVFMPRRFTMQTGEGRYEVVTPYWALHSCVREGDAVSVRGTLLSDKRTVALLNSDHFLSLAAKEKV